LIDSLLNSCEDLQIIATSREALRIAGEISYRVPSLELPKWDAAPVMEALANIESVRLFVERAAVVSPGFNIGSHNGLIIAQICQRLDGIPLSIELAAARVNVLAVEQILKRLDDRFNLLTGGLRNVVPRQQTLRGTIEWSYDLLSEKERLLFRRLAVFTGGWTLEAAEKVCSGNGIESHEVLDLLTHLANKSLVLVETIYLSRSQIAPIFLSGKAQFVTTGIMEGKTRYYRLETLRQFAREKLSESTEAAQLHRNHAMYYSHLDSIPDNELDNIRSVVHWCLETGEAEPVLRLAGDFFYWEKRIPEGLQWITRVLALPSAQGKTQERGRALYSAAVLSHFQRNYAMARTLVNELFILSHELNDRDLIWDHKLIHGAVTIGEGDYERAYSIFLENRIHADSFDYAFGYALSTLNMAFCALLLHHLDAASQYAAEARQIFDAVNTTNYLVDSDMILGYIALEEGNLPLAKTYFRQGIQTAVSNSVQQRLGMIYAGLGGVALWQGNSHEAARWFGIAEMIITTTGYYARFLLETISQGYRAQVRSLLDPDVFQAAWEEGRAMTIEQAVEYTLKELQ
jgi:non-specific serine/threonine protein kinase